MSLLVSAKDYLHLTLNRPEAKNALNEDLIAKLSENLDKYKDDPKIKCLLLEANGDVFCAGADLNMMKNSINLSKEGNIENAFLLAKMLKKLYDFPKPTICKVKGGCLGGAVGIVSACDIAIAQENAFAVFSEVRLGLIPAMISPFVINAIGRRAANRYFLTAEKINSQKAKEIGLFHDLISNEEIDQYVANIVKKICGFPLIALCESKKLLRDKKIISENELYKLSVKIADIRKGEEAQTAIKAFFEKVK